MKKTDLEKNQFLKIAGKVHQGGSPSRFGQAANSISDRREQRKQDQALGLVPFAVKLNADLVAQLQTLATERRQPLNELVSSLLQKGLAA